MPFLKTETGINLYYQEQGQGQPVVFIHGWPLNSEMWEYQLAELPKHGIRAIAYDRRGFGKSDRPYDSYDYDTLAADLNSVIEGLGLEAVTLVGFSMGGGEVIRYLTRYGNKRIARLALISSVVPYVLQTADNPDGVPKAMLDGFVKKIDDDRPAFLQEFGKIFYGQGLLKKPVSQAFLDWNQMLALQSSHKATVDCVRVFSETDFRSELPSIRLPALVIHGDADKTVPIAATGQVASKLLPNATYNVYEGAPHGVFYVEKDRLNSDLLTFIKAAR
ncbi:MAG: Pimeloyl-ACP methyl ester carboxylesterase [Myxococcaceae bacterium]|nr:Pimeloyl-ACP methyl ester carboxylesterase [Myxococcaceae bacterium]